MVEWLKGWALESKVLNVKCGRYRLHCPDVLKAFWGLWASSHRQAVSLSLFRLERADSLCRGPAGRPGVPGEAGRGWACGGEWEGELGSQAAMEHGNSSAMWASRQRRAEGCRNPDYGDLPCFLSFP